MIFDLKNRSGTFLVQDISKKEGAKEAHWEPSQKSKMELFVKLATGHQRCSHQRCSVKKGVLKIFANLTGRYVLQSLLIKLQALKPATLCKRDSNTGVFLWMSRNSGEQLFFLIEHLWWQLLNSTFWFLIVASKIVRKNLVLKLIVTFFRDRNQISFLLLSEFKWVKRV